MVVFSALFIRLSIDIFTIYFRILVFLYIIPYLLYKGNVELPAARYNHSAATIETDYWIFGGENSAGDILGDIWCADINSKKL